MPVCRPSSSSLLPVVYSLYNIVVCGWIYCRANCSPSSVCGGTVALTVNGGMPGREMLVFIVVPGAAAAVAVCGGTPYMDTIGTGAVVVVIPKGDGVVWGQEAYVGMLIGVCWMVWTGGAYSIIGTGTAVCVNAWP